MAIIKVAEFSPDQPAFQNPGSGLIENVIPATTNSYGPFPSPTLLSGPIANRCQGATSVRDTSGNARIFCGDSSKLYRMEPSVTAPSNVSAVGGYTTSNSERWSFAYFGTAVIATNFSN